jgi:hypothetical protein
MQESQSFRILGSEILLRTRSQAVQEGFQHLLSGFLVADTSPLKSPERYEVLPGKNCLYQVLQNKSTLSRHDTISDLLAQTELHILTSVYRNMPFFGIHAGAVTFRKKTILFPGRSGCGKSSLVLGLVLGENALLLSDEMGPVLPNNSEIIAFPRVLCAKHGSIELLRKFDTKGHLAHPDATMDLDGVCCVSSSHLPRDKSCGSHPVDLIVFPNYHQACEATIEHISKSRALSNLMRNSIASNRFPDRGLSLCGRLVDRAKCYSLRSSTLEDAIKLVTSICKPEPTHLTSN